MFGWFRPTCPCDPAAKQWTEDRLRWLTKQFGMHILLERPIILPTPEFFPDPYDGSKKAVRVLLDQVCEYMDVVPALVSLKFVADAGKIWRVNEAGQAVDVRADRLRRHVLVRPDRRAHGVALGMRDVVRGLRRRRCRG